MFNDDKPIGDSSDDLLERSGYAKNFARALINSESKDGFVSAVYGQWGSGKSSFKNLVIESLRIEERQPVIIEFNPWRWSGDDKLFHVFFDEIGKGMGLIVDNENLKDAAKKWKVYYSYFALGSSMAKSVGFVGGTFNPAFLASGIAVWLVMRQMAELIGYAHKSLKAEIELSKRNMESVRLDLVNALNNLDRKIVIVIDDVDRLNGDEIRLLFQLVKANSNLPNLVFVLLFQRDLIEKALNQCAPNDNGSLYLEKIIQIGIDLPYLRHDDLEKIFFNELDKIITMVPTVIHKWDELYRHDWGNLYEGGFKSLFKTIRQVYRYINSLSFIFLGYVDSDNDILVNPVDLFAVEAIRVFEPALYQELIKQKESLLGNNYELPDNRGKAYNELKNKLLNLVSEERRDSIESVLMFLFPILSNHTKGDTGVSLRNKRISHDLMFDRYFSFNLREGELTESQILELIGNQITIDGLIKRLNEYNDQSRIGQVLEAFEAYQDKIEALNYDKVFLALFTIGDIFFKLNSELFNTPEIRAYRLTRYLLKKIDIEARNDVFKKAVQRSTGLFFPISFIHHEASKNDRDNYPDEFAFPLDGLSPLKVTICERIKELAACGTLIDSPALSYILFAWSEWCDSGFVQEYISENIDEPGVLEKLLKSFIVVTKISSAGEHVSRRKEEINITAMNKLGILDTVTFAIDMLDESDEEILNLKKLFRESNDK